MSRPLPARPSLEQLRRQARDLQRDHAAGDPDAVAAVAALDLAPPPGLRLPLATARLALARRYGFPSWPRLVAHLAVVAEHQRVHTAVADGADPADVFLDRACLAWDRDDGPHRWAAAARVLAEHPDLPGAAVAAVTADVPRLRAALAADPGAATAATGPRRWAPLMYLACARHDPGVAGAAVLDAARLLLDHGADPDTGYLFDGLPCPFTALTGVLGGGEGGQPPHPHAEALARLLLERGADPNDGQALYNRMFAPDDGHLRLLLAHGLGTGDGGPWHRRMPDATDDPATMLREQLHWAATHGFDDRIRLLAAHGVDVAAPQRGGRTPAQLAALAGRPHTVAALTALGAPPPDLTPVEALTAAALTGDAAAVARIRAAHPGALRDTCRLHPGLVVRAAAARSVAGVRLLVRLGFDLDALGRFDVAGEGRWETALHGAAFHADTGMVDVLLALGADASVRDRRFDATPGGWARHAGHDALADRLDTLAGEQPRDGSR